MTEQTRPRTVARQVRDRRVEQVERAERTEQAADRIGEAIRFPLTVARRILPDRELPVYLGMGALAVAGVIDWPVAAAAGLGYAAFRRWGGSSEGPQQRVEQGEEREGQARRAERIRSDGQVSGSRHTMTRR
ncbi:MAG TPA: hypothetical protein VIR27_15545 [Mycobacteriales bacterium]|jgi:hypothetical protein